MFSNQTGIIGLPQYEGSDKLQRADMNGAYLAIDDAIGARPAANVDGKYPAAVTADMAKDAQSGGLLDKRIATAEEGLKGKADLGADKKLADSQVPAAAKVGMTAPAGMKSANVQAGFTELAGRFGADGAANNALKLGGKAYAALFDTNGNAQNALKLGGVAAAQYGTTEHAELTLLNGWTYADNTPGYLPKACRCGNTVTINGVIKGGTTDIWTQLFILPKSMRPKNSKYIATSTGAGHSTYFINPTDGAVSAVLFRKDSTVHINCSFGLD